jgi:hypothetical protein
MLQEPQKTTCHRNLFLGCIRITFIVIACTCTAYAASADKLVRLARAYVDKAYDERESAYQAAAVKLQLIKALDAELTKVRPSAAVTPAHPAWKNARDQLLEAYTAAVEQHAGIEKIAIAYQTTFPLLLLSEADVDTLLEFVNSEDGKQYLQIRKLSSRKQAIERYIVAYAAAIDRNPTPALIPDEKLTSDLMQVAADIKKLAALNEDTTRRINTFVGRDPWKKIESISGLAGFQMLGQLSASGKMDSFLGLLGRLVSQAAGEFKDEQVLPSQ